MTTTEPDDRAFVLLVERMRKSQRAWFSHHSPSDLTEAKRLEKQVDLAIDAVLRPSRAPQPTLFS